MSVLFSAETFACVKLFLVISSINGSMLIVGVAVPVC